jgi:hypothetical protein
VFCEWPLGATLAEAQEMATCAKARGLKTIVGLQARSDPTLMYARQTWPRPPGSSLLLVTEGGVPNCAVS